MYKVKQSDLIGDIKGFPIEVVQKMVERQVEQGNKADVTVFQKIANAPKWRGGFDFEDTIEKHVFWSDIMDGNFDIFFEYYPNKNVYYGGVKGRGDEVIKALESLGANNKNNCAGSYADHLYYIDENNNINSCCYSTALGNILQRGFTELFLPKTETVEIGGKKFRKDEVMERINGLKEIKS
jgi:hypothetical protein